MVKTYTEQKLIDALERNYLSGYTLWIRNAYIFGDWESDFLNVARSGYCNEFEVKISRSDFFNDFKKVRRHSVMKNGTYVYWFNNEVRTQEFRPNRFWYVVPAGLIRLEEIPEYAGLIYCKPLERWPDTLDIEIVKPAPVLHKQKFDFEKKLCVKYFYHLQNARKEIRDLKKIITEHGTTTTN